MQTQDSAQMQIGWAMADVTPSQPVNLQGQFHMRISQGVRDPLTATALALAGGGDAAVLLSVDNCFLPAPVIQGIRAAVSNQTPDLDPSKIIINATHTHTAPMLEDGMYPPTPPGVMTGRAYANFLVERAAQAIVNAWRARAPGQVAWGLGQAVVGRNRRAVYFDDLAQRPGYKNHPGHCTTRNAAMYGNTNDPLFSHIEGYEDHSVDLLYTWNARGELTGVVVNLACPAQETEGLSLISADFWHDARGAIRRQLGGKVCILPQCSAAGDQSPHPLWYKGAEKRMQELRGLDSRAEIARRIAQTVVEVLPLAGKDRRDNPPLRHVAREVKIPRRMITAAEAEMVRAGIAELEARPLSADPDAGRRQAADSARATALRRCQITLERFQRQKKEPELSVEAHAIRLGDVAFATFPFELFLDYGIRIKARSPALQTFLIQLANACAGWDGNYLPTARAEQGESYSANFYCNSVGAAGGRTLVEALLQNLHQAWPDGK